MLSRLRRKRLVLGSLTLCLLTTLSFYLLSDKYFPRDSSEKRSQNLKVSVQALKENNADNAVPRDSEETTLQTPPEIAEIARGSLVVLEMEDKEGKLLGFWSGFFVKRDQVATYFRAIEGAAKGAVRLAGKQQRFRIEGITASSEKHGLVILKVPDFGGQALSLGNSNTVQNNDEIHVAGNPWFSLEEETTLLEGTVTSGIISKIHQKTSSNNFLKFLSRNTGIFLDKVLQMSVQVHTGCSGGPVLNRRGEVIGVSFRTIKDGQILNCIVPSNYLEILLTQLKSPSPLIKGKPASAFAYIVWASTKFEQERYESAIVDYDEAIRLKPDFAEAYNLRGAAKYKLGAYESAIVDFDQGIKLKPKTVESEFHLAYAYKSRGIAKLELGDYQSAIVDFDETIRIDPNDADNYISRGEARFLLGDYKASKADYSKAIQLKPDFSEVWSKRGFANRALSEYESAITDSEEAIRLDPNNAEAYFNSGEAKSSLKDYLSAIADYDAAIKLRPEVVEAYKSRAQVKFILGAYPAAILDFDEILKLNPDDTGVYNKRGTAKFLVGIYESAIADFDEAIRLKPDEVFTYFLRGMTKVRQNRINDAKLDFREASKLAKQSDDESLQFIIEQLPQTNEDLRTFVEQVIQSWNFYLLFQIE